MPEKETSFARLSHRVKAVIIDSIMLIIFMIAVTNLFDMFESVPDSARITAFVFIFFLYDPIFTSSFGGTIGHMLIGIRVKRENDTSRNIIFPLALIRFLVKAALGWISLLTVTSNKKSKAIHDSIVRSVVIEK
ncbi:RDD family protein [Puteibacter caeruleilacunae]|nr:RDD family protein [Puteibacter caeruleilacunae]